MSKLKYLVLIILIGITITEAKNGLYVNENGHIACDKTNEEQLNKVNDLACLLEPYTQISGRKDHAERLIRVYRDSGSLLIDLDWYVHELGKFTGYDGRYGQDVKLGGERVSLVDYILNIYHTFLLMFVATWIVFLTLTFGS